MHQRLLALGVALLPQLSHAQHGQIPLKSNEVFLTEQSRIVNSATYQGNQLIRKSLKGDSFTIPKDWKLISVIKDEAKSDSRSEFILFFQDSKSAVHSIGVQNNGYLSGNNLIFIPASE
jgi:hypothetical protein